MPSYFAVMQKAKELEQGYCTLPYQCYACIPAIVYNSHTGQVTDTQVYWYADACTATITLQGPNLIKATLAISKFKQLVNSSANVCSGHYHHDQVYCSNKALANVLTNLAVK